MRNHKCYGSLNRPLAITLMAVASCFSNGFFSPHSTGYAQIERYELGKRLRRFEKAWQTATAVQQAESTRPMQQAVQSFFSFNLARAASKLDEAWIYVRDTDTAEWERHVLSHRIEIDSTLPDWSEPEMPVSLTPLYRTGAAAPEAASVKLVVANAGGLRLKECESTWQACVVGNSIHIGDLPEGDYWLKMTVTVGNRSLPLPPIMFSRLLNPASHVEELRQAARAQPESATDTAIATLREYAAMLAQADKLGRSETDYPWYRLVAFADTLAQAEPGASGVIAQAARQRDHWLVLARGRERVPVRLQAPVETSGPLPVLFLFHGAGGSENMFFETYGAGMAVTAGLERGWLVVAPRQALMGLNLDVSQMLNALEEIFEINRDQVYLLGHSMGAAQVIHQMRQAPQLPKAAAVIGGGRAIPDASDIAGVPWYVAAGELDFGKRGAQAFWKSLQQAIASHSQYQEFPNIEHMVIVQAALPAVFEFFDQLN